MTNSDLRIQLRRGRLMPRRWCWQLVDADGLVLARSPGYRDRQSCLIALQRAVGGITNAAVEDRTEERGR